MPLLFKDSKDLLSVHFSEFAYVRSLKRTRAEPRLWLYFQLSMHGTLLLSTLLLRWSLETILLLGCDKRNSLPFQALRAVKTVAIQVSVSMELMTVIHYIHLFPGVKLTQNTTSHLLLNHRSCFFNKSHQMNVVPKCTACEIKLSCCIFSGGI